MSTLTGVIETIDAKVSAKGRAYHRLKIRSLAGNVSWWTYFGQIHEGSLGATVVCSLKAMGDGEIIDDYHVTEPGNSSPSPRQPGPQASAAAAGAAPGGTRDQWIFIECVIQAVMKADAQPGDEPVSQEYLQTVTAYALDACVAVSEVLRVYNDKGRSDAANLIRSLLPGSPGRMAAEMAERAVQRSTERSSDDGEMDDDIPF